MTMRRAIVLSALSGAPLDRIQLMKTVFLPWYRHGESPDAPFVFEAYNYGAFCKAVYDTLGDLLRDGLVDQYETGNPQTAPYFVTALGAKYDPADYLLAKDNEELQTIAKWAAKQSFNSLLKNVYREAPKYAENSLVKDAILGV